MKHKTLGRIKHLNCIRKMLLLIIISLFFIQTAAAGNYTGNSSNCQTCHPDQYALWANSTHTSKLITRDDAIVRSYPNPPGGYSWENVSFVIGSKWKIRYVNDTGYIITNGGKNQFNIDDQVWTDYNPNTSKPYICGNCHNTGYLSNVSDTVKEPFRTLREQGKIPDGVYDNSLTPGFTGYWAENSIGCEACHGPGEDHINSPSTLNIRNAADVRNTPGICGNCHSRPNTGEYENFKPYPDGVNDTLLNDTLYDSSPMPTVDYSKVGGHHEQWEDWKAGGHAGQSVNCVSCHGGHAVSDSAYAGGPTGKTTFTNGTVYPAAVNRTCTDCHSVTPPKHGYYTNNSECISCHMTLNRKSANKIDLRSHWFNTSAMKRDKNGEIHGYNFPVLKNVSSSCTICHGTQSGEVSGTKHNKTLNTSAPSCTDCHTSGYSTYIVNETNTCRRCHIDGVKGFYERHTGSSDCTTCHFANTTQPFSLNTSLFRHDHNLKVERNFYEYNISGMPLRINGGVGAGMFPYYTCTLTCHRYNETTGVEGKIDEAANSWNQSNHARSLRYPLASDNKNNCAKCKSPANYNDSLTSLNPVIAAADWQGIQCRVCHNLHDRRFPNNTGPRGMPIAFYNSTLSSRAGYAVYDQVSSPTQLCEKCHIGATHDSKFGGTHKNTVGFNCTNCHLNTSFNNEAHMFEVKNTTSGVTGCEVCHKAENHTFPYTVNHTGKATCEACHDKTVSRNATGYAVSSDGKTYGLYNDTSTGEISSWKDSHGSPATWPLHNISKEVNCAKCHMTKSKSTGTVLAGSILAHTGSGTCDECHVVTPGSDFTLPVTKLCKACHTTYADQYGAPNLTGTAMAGYTSCGGNSCHKDAIGTTTMDTVADHNIDRNYNGGGVVTYTVFLNGQNSLTITQGTTPVTIRSNISDAGTAGKVAAAQFQLRNSTNQILINWTALSALDGKFNAVNGVWERITGSIDTAGMPAGTYTISVRGMDIGKQWSATQAATLTITEPTGFVNGTVTNVTGGAVAGVTVRTNTTVSTVTDGQGGYSLSLPAGAYILTATKDPEYQVNNTIPLVVVPVDYTPVIQDIVMTTKPTGNITGSVTNV
ncbi:MAG: hypothetical protein FIB08_05905 [Candidatus Methanoperedens sp.]|nr:hypothetical protein [Candidatus Methanoperedens sp.]